ncbi:MAG TPA: branched-chain amino acid ABC transporter permease [Ramlibacter sp.]|uniref:branched-chain amino acid ABC transporter permease n=1 Tax=Ramlibacter sp. TaxID=1917967 RepID=UPI002C8B835B|nr:branched-chain amino acid ABC transporter permease [Ramlibacter sp.]HVZ45793.1 branched-chain amino acid ABC transporter permease [Ramlibacter sp.]
MEFAVINLLNGLSYGMLLFMLAAGLTLIFSMMGVLNFAHVSFYMLGAYVGYSISIKLGFWAGLVIAPVLLGFLGAAVERYGLRSVHRHGHVHELLYTFGLAYVATELVQVIWGRAPVPYKLPAVLEQPLFTLFSTTFPVYRAFMILTAVAMLGACFAVLKFTRIGLVIQAALTHPSMVESLGHDVPRVFMLVFGGGSALAALAGAIGGSIFSTEPSMAQSIGSIVFVVIVIGGLGSLAGAFVASLLIGIVQTTAVAMDQSLATLLKALGIDVGPSVPGYAVLSTSIAQLAPLLPYLAMVLILTLRPRGLLGTRA